VIIGIGGLVEDVMTVARISVEGLCDIWKRSCEAHRDRGMSFLREADKPMLSASHSGQLSSRGKP